jgi:hypothetical protein
MLLRLFVATLTLLSLALSQTSTGTLTGTITDSTGARLPNVNLKLTSEATAVALTAVSNTNGEYTFPLLPSGRYTLSAESKGFQSLAQKGITIELARVSRLDFVLTLGTVAESIDVSSSAPLLDTDSSTAGQFIENKTIADMPLNGRRVGELLGLSGNAIMVTGDVIRPRVSLAGGRADQQQWMLDGVNASNIALENPQALFNPPVESVQEIRIQSNTYSAEFGNSSGGVILTTTKSGTNKLKGSAYEYFRNEKLDARNFFAASRPPLRWNVFGFTLGGPIVIPRLYNGKNKTFFFTSLEWQRQRIGAVRNQTVPTALERAGDFSQTRTAANNLLPIYDPNTSPRQLFPQNIIPPSRLDPIGLRLATFYPNPNATPINPSGAQNFRANATSALNITTSTSKVDHVFSEKDRVNVRFVLHDFPTFVTPIYPEAAADGTASTSLRRAYSTLVNHIHNFTPTTINDFRFNWQPRFFRQLSPGLDEGWPSRIGLRGVSDRAFPRVNPAGYASLGNATQERIQTPIYDLHMVNAVTTLKGKHAFKYGGEVRWGRNVDVFNPAISGNFTFGVNPTALIGTANTGNGLASLLLGFPTAASTQSTQPLDRTSWYLAGFFHDDWKLTNNFTLNIGLRWETHTPRLDANNRQNGFSYEQINPVSGTPGVVTFAGLNGQGRTVYNGDYNNWAPRIGFAWKPFGSTRTVVRSAYGIFYGPPVPGSNTNSAGFEVAVDVSTPDNGITAPFLLRNGFPANATQPALDASLGAVRVGQVARYNPTFIELDRRLGYSQQWNFIVQHQLPGQTLAEVGYIANVGRRLNGPNTSVNQVRPELMGAGNAQARRPFPQFGNVVSQSPFWGNSNYHSLNLKIEKRFSNGLNFLTNYTFSKFIDDVPSGFENGNVPGGIQNFYDRRAERSLSGNDVRNRLVTSGVYELPVGQGRKFLTSGPANWVLGGWNLGVIMTLQAGSPNSVTTQANTTNAFNPGAQRANQVGDPNLPSSDRSPTRWFNTAAFVQPAQFTFGNVSRAAFTGPSLQNFDMSLLKNFPFMERFNLQFRFESFNILNKANFEDPNTSLGSPGFGTLGAARAARSIQFGLRLSF